MTTGNTFPPPLGPTVSFQPPEAVNTTTANFTFNEKGLYCITFEAHQSQPGTNQSVDQLFPGTVTLQQFTAPSTNAALLAMTQPGVYYIVLPPGGYTMNFNCTNGARNIRMTKLIDDRSM